MQYRIQSATRTRNVSITSEFGNSFYENKIEALNYYIAPEESPVKVSSYNGDMFLRKEGEFVWGGTSWEKV
jgi:hypothetical protein